jgi:hypothetical protein
VRWVGHAVAIRIAEPTGHNSRGLDRDDDDAV